MLAVFAVDNLNDVGAGSLRQAIEDANGAAGADTIEFQAGLSGTIALLTGEMLISEELFIDGPGAEQLTIDAQGNSRFFRVDAASGDVTISGLELTGGDAFEGGGAIRSETSALLSIQSSRISGNEVSIFNGSDGGAVFATGDVSIAESVISDNLADYGGGIYSLANVTVSNSTISGNVSQGFASFGAGIFARGDVSISGSMVLDNDAYAGGGGIAGGGDVTVSDSTISGNAGSFGYGGGILSTGNVTISNTTISDSVSSNAISASGSVTVTDSTISDNLGFYAGIDATGDVFVANSTISGNAIFSFRGGGINSKANVTVLNSTITDNYSYYGAGINADGDVTVMNSTISGNEGDYGGGINAYGSLTVRHSTITGNSADSGGGIMWHNFPVTIENSIVAGNSAPVGPDLSPGAGELSISHSLIGDNSDTTLVPAPVGMPDTDGNLIGTSAAPIDPMFGPLQDNGGATHTHALLAGSPAIDAGDTSATPPPAVDQRGFERIVDGGSGVPRVDMGAYEFASTLAGDGNGNNVVGEDDYTIWANNFGVSGAEVSGDYNNDGRVGPEDYTVWANNYGADETAPAQVASAADFSNQAVPVASRNLGLTLVSTATDHGVNRVSIDLAIEEVTVADALAIKSSFPSDSGANVHGRDTDVLERYWAYFNVQSALDEHEISIEADAEEPIAGTALRWL